MKSPFRSLLLLSTPVVLGNIAAAANELVNRYVLGQVSEAALAASLPGSMLALVFTGVFTNTIGYATALIAKARGAGDEALERRTFVQALWLTAATVPFFALVVPIGIIALQTIGHAPDVLRNEIVYFSFSALGGLLSVNTTALGTYHAGRGKTAVPAAAALAGCLTDIIATPLLVLVANLGITGAGLGKSCGLLVTVLILAFFVLRDLSRLPPISGLSAFERTTAIRLLKLGFPFGLSSVVGSGTFTVFVMCLGACGAEVLAVGNICFALNNLFNTMLTGVETAIVIAIGNCKGADDANGARRFFYAGLRLALLALAVCYGPVLSVSDGLVTFFLGNAVTDEALSLARFFLFRLFIGGLFETVKHISTGALRSTGHTTYIFTTHLIVSGGLWMPATIALTTAHNPRLLLLATALYTALHALVLSRRIPKALQLRNKD